MTGNNIYEYLHPSDHDELAALLNQPTTSHNPRLLHGLALPAAADDDDDDDESGHAKFCLSTSIGLQCVPRTSVVSVPFSFQQ